MKIFVVSIKAEGTELACLTGVLVNFPEPFKTILRNKKIFIPTSALVLFPPNNFLNGFFNCYFIHSVFFY